MGTDTDTVMDMVTDMVTGMGMVMVTDIIPKTVRLEKNLY